MGAQNIPHPMMVGKQPSLWWDADFGGTITPGTGSGVSQFSEVSGNSKVVTQGTVAAQPLTGVETLNGHNVLTFNGAQSMAAGPLLGLSDYTIFIVAWSDSLANEGRIIHQRGSGGTVVDIYQTALGQVTLYDGTSVQGTITGLISSGVAFQTTLRLKRNVVNGSTIRFNGRTDVKGDFTFAPTGAGSNFVIGNFVYFWDGAIAPILVYPFYLTTQAVRWIELYLHNRFGTPWSDSLG